MGAAGDLPVYVPLVEYYCRWKEQHYQNVIHEYDDAGEYSESTHRHQLAGNVDEEGHSRCTASHCHCPHTSSKSVRHPLLDISSEQRYLLTLSPPINENKDVISSNPQDDEHHHGVQHTNIRDFENSFAYYLTYWKTENNK